MTEKLNFIGTVEQVIIKPGQSGTRKWQRATYTVDGKKFGTFDDRIIGAFKQGDLVSIDYIKEGVFNNIEDMHITEKAGGSTLSTHSTHFPPVDSLRDKLIVRQSCLKAACDVWFEAKGDKSILQMAEEFEAWVWRQ